MMLAGGRPLDGNRSKSESGKAGEKTRQRSPK